ncbi:MAG: nickel pincer cofactor biosynthesis protein LarC [Cyanobacteria bacterium P01_H01_bin.153]
MKTLAFLDCPTGISGDMCLGALVNAGVPLAFLQSQIALLQLPETVKLQATEVRKNGIAATKVNVILPHERNLEVVHPPNRHLHDIEQMITAAALPARAIAWSLAIFRRLAEAEGAIHGVEPQSVHFHEVGATDAIVDIVGTCLGLDWLDIDELYCTPLPTGRGTVRAAHGRLPVPAPAVLKLMEMAHVPLYNAGLVGELVTPTGAAIATELAAHFGEPPAMQLQKVGLGAGNKDLPLPNMLRLWLGKAALPLTLEKAAAAAAAPPHAHGVHDPNHAASASHPHPHNHQPEQNDQHQSPPSAAMPEAVAAAAIAGTNPPPSSVTPSLPAADMAPPIAKTAAETMSKPAIEARSGEETVTVLETQVDDLSPQAIGYLYDRLFAVGALDVFVQPVTMKKSRLGHLMTAITYPEQAAACEAALLQETTTLGVRRTQQTRLRLRREIVSLTLALGTVRMKVAYLPNCDRPLKAHPEYEDCAAIARQHQMPWREVHQQAIIQWHQQSL